MKKILLAIPVLLIVLAGFFALNWYMDKPDDSNLPKLEFVPGAAYEYKPSSLDDWELVIENVKLGLMPLDTKLKLIEENVTEAANWEYKRGSEDLYVWAKTFDSNEDAMNAAKDFSFLMAWKTRTKLAFAQDGAVGVWDNLRNEPPLFLYVVEDNVLVHIAYYNEDGNYNAEDISNDNKFLIDLVKEMLE